MKHRLLNDQLIRGVNGVSARCICGWLSGNYISAVDVLIPWKNHLQAASDLTRNEKPLDKSPDPE